MAGKISIFSSDVAFCGNVVGSGAIDVSGYIKGNAVAEAILVKKGGFIEGNVYADELVLSQGGRICGKVYAKSLKVLSGAKVSGDVAYSSLSMEDGAKLVGSFIAVDASNIENTIDEVKQKLNIVAPNME